MEHLNYDVFNVKALKYAWNTLKYVNIYDRFVRLIC